MLTQHFKFPLAALHTLHLSRSRLKPALCTRCCSMVMRSLLQDFGKREARKRTTIICGDCTVTHFPDTIPASDCSRSRAFAPNTVL